MKNFRGWLAAILVAALCVGAHAQSRFAVVVEGKRIAERTIDYTPEITGDLIVQVVEVRTEDGERVTVTTRYVLDSKGNLVSAREVKVVGQLREELELTVKLGSADIEKKVGNFTQSRWTLQAPSGNLLGMPHWRWFGPNVAAPEVGKEIKVFLPTEAFSALQENTLRYEGKRTIDVQGKKVEAHAIRFVESYRVEFYDNEGRLLGATGEDDFGRPLALRKIG